jgi:Asp-tRNA(Asn)/Glu-tRNA(Gln) amidotransferase A subunit family amidase
VGKTNLPEWASDFQSYNEVAGTTNNPWSPERTSGGSTGGGAAALACGRGFLELGSDIGGSIRTPSHFCGVFGHKPTIDVISDEGLAEPPDRPECSGSRTPGTCRRRAVRGCAITASATFPFCPVAPDVRRQLELAIDALGKAGARLTQG